MRTLTMERRNAILLAVQNGIDLQIAVVRVGITWKTWNKWRRAAEKAADEEREDDPFLIWFNEVSREWAEGLFRMSQAIMRGVQSDHKFAFEVRKEMLARPPMKSVETDDEPVFRIEIVEKSDSDDPAQRTADTVPSPSDLQYDGGDPLGSGRRQE